MRRRFLGLPPLGGLEVDKYASHLWLQFKQWIAKFEFERSCMSLESREKELRAAALSEGTEVRMGEMRGVVEAEQANFFTADAQR